MTKLIIAVVGGTLILSAVFIFASSSKENSGKIEINPQEYDLGDISMAAGSVKKTYEIKNSGDSELKIDKIWTSCHCTTARLKIESRESPEFDMDTNLPMWAEKLAPGETGHLDVVFDPAYHGHAGMGSIVRVVYLSTSDPNNQRVEIKLLANVIE